MNVNQMQRLGEIAERLEAEAKSAQRIIESIKLSVEEYQDFLVEQIKLARESK